MSSDDYIYGLHAVEKALQHNADNLGEIWLEQKRHDKRVEQIISLAEKHRVKFTRVDSRELEQRVPEASHQGVVASLQKLRCWSEKELPDLLDAIDGPPFLLILDGVQDPHNLGACLRSADAAGVHAVIVPKDKSVAITAVVRKVASGAAEHIPFIQVTNLARCMRDLQQLGIWLVGTADAAQQTLYDQDLKGPIAIVMGGEGKGLRRLTQEQCDFLVSLPMLGIVESLNVSVAAGVCLFEALRQRR